MIVIDRIHVHHKRSSKASRLINTHRLRHLLLKFTSNVLLIIPMACKMIYRLIIIAYKILVIQ